MQVLNLSMLLSLGAEQPRKSTGQRILRLSLSYFLSFPFFYECNCQRIFYIFRILTIWNEYYPRRNMQSVLPAGWTMLQLQKQLSDSTPRPCLNGFHPSILKQGEC